jgi:amino acid permease
MEETSDQGISMRIAIVALVNGMIGGSILVLPVVSLNGGWMVTLLVISFTGFFSFYCCYLAIIHMGDQKDLDAALLRHFNGSHLIKIVYDLCVFLGLSLLLILYFDLIVLQWENLVPPYIYTLANVFSNGLLLLGCCLVMKYFEFGANLMGYGLVSTLGYLVFLVWVVASRPEGGNSFPAVGNGIAGFAAMMGNAFGIQGFFIPVLKRHRPSSNYVPILITAFATAAGSYYFIAYMGAIGTSTLVQAY